MDIPQEPLIYSIIGTRIREFRNQKDKSQDELARDVGVSRTSIVNIEQGRQRLPIHLLWQIGDVLDVDPGNFIPDIKDLREHPEAKKVNDKILKAIEYTSRGNTTTRNKLIEFAVD